MKIWEIKNTEIVVIYVEETFRQPVFKKCLPNLQQTLFMLQFNSFIAAYFLFAAKILLF